MRIRRHGATAIAVLVLAAAAVIAAHHAYTIRHRGFTDLELIAAVAFAWLTLTTVAPYLHRDTPLPRRGTPERDQLQRLRVTAIIPAHNEDPVMFRTMLDSLAKQTWPLSRIHVVENGDPDRGYAPALFAVFNQWRQHGRPPHVEAAYTFNPVPDKKHAQAVAVQADPYADVYMTIDSDVKASPGAVAHGLAPFLRTNVTSVAGLLLGLNRTANWLTRLIEPGFVCASLNGRAAQAMFGGVSVNSGGLAFYRGSVVRKYMTHYLAHTVAGRRMTNGDDAMMTRYAALEGRTVFQANAWGYTLHPEKLGHLTKQRVRWWRSFFWGNLWLLQAFRPTRLMWWMTAWQFLLFAWMTVALPVVLVVHPVQTGRFAWLVLAWAVAVSYLSTARYLTIARPDETFRAHVAMWLLAAPGAVLNFYLGFVLSYVGLATCLKTGWSSRQTVDVAYREAGAAVPVADGGELASVWDESRTVTFPAAVVDG